jgi:hypothetical protein
MNNIFYQDEEHGAEELGGQALSDLDHLATDFVNAHVGKERNNAAHVDWFDWLSLSGSKIRLLV